MGRSKGFGTLVKRGKYWQCKVTVDGVNHYKATGTASKVEAKKILEEFARPFQSKNELERLAVMEARIQMKESELSDSEEDYSNVLLTDILDRYYKMANAKPVSDGTLENYKKFVEKFTEWLSAEHRTVVKVRDVTKLIAEKYLAHFKSNVSAGYYNGMLSTFRKIWSEFGRLSKHHCFRENPWGGFKYKTVDQSVKRALTAEEISRIFEVIKKPDVALLFKIGLYTGMRKGDCCNLKWSDIDMERRLISVVPDKTKRYNCRVVIPIHQVLYEELETRAKALPENPDSPGSDYVCAWLAHKYEANNFDFVRAAFRDAGIKTDTTVDGKRRMVVSFHSLRHTFVSMAVSAGIQLDVVRQITGHNSLKMAEHYSHASTAALEKAVNAIPDVGASVARKSLVEVDSEILKELNSMGLTVEDALKELISVKKNTIDVKPHAA